MYLVLKQNLQQKGSGVHNAANAEVPVVIFRGPEYKWANICLSGESNRQKEIVNIFVSLWRVP